jgi:hypothetical protein
LGVAFWKSQDNQLPFLKILPQNKMFLNGEENIIHTMKTLRWNDI